MEIELKLNKDIYLFGDWEWVKMGDIHSIESKRNKQNYNFFARYLLSKNGEIITKLKDKAPHLRTFYAYDNAVYFSSVHCSRYFTKAFDTLMEKMDFYHMYYDDLEMAKNQCDQFIKAINNFQAFI
jgi:hypothetical protein